MRGEAVFDAVSPGLPEALEAIALVRDRLRTLSDGDFRALLTELAEKDPINAVENELLALCLTESAARFVRLVPADADLPDDSE